MPSNPLVMAVYVLKCFRSGTYTEIRVNDRDLADARAGILRRAGWTVEIHRARIN